MTSGEMFGRRLRELLQENDLKQKELAKAVGITEVTVSRYLSGKRAPRSAILTRIADYFGVPASYLLPTKAGLQAEYDAPPTDGYRRVVTLVRVHSGKWSTGQCALLMRMLAKAIEKQTRVEEKAAGDCEETDVTE